MRKEKRTRGAISVFLSIILVPCIVISCLFVDASRVSLSRTSAESSADLALNTLLTNYDADLKEWYGLVASCQNIKDFYKVSAQYFLRSLASQGMSDDEVVLLSDYYAQATGDDTIYDLLKVEAVSQPNVAAITGSDLSNPGLMKDQIVEFMKYRAPIEVTRNIIDRFKNSPGLDGALDGEENEPMVNDKQECYEAEGELSMKAIRSYWAIREYHNAVNKKFTNDSLKGIYDEFEGYRDAYHQIMPYAVKNFAGTAGLQRFYRATVDLNCFGDNYTNPDKSFDAVYSKKEKDEEKEKNGDEDPYNYYIDYSTIKSLMDTLTAKRDAFRTAVTSFGDAASSMVAKLPCGTGAGETNPIQWWAQTYAAVKDHAGEIQSKGTEMVRAYAKVKAIDECTLKGSAPSGWSGLGEWKSKLNYSALISDVEGLQRDYLVAGKYISGDNYLMAVSNLETVSREQIGNINPGSLKVTIGGKSDTVPGHLNAISSALKSHRSKVDSYIKLLDIAIDGKPEKKIPSMIELREAVEHYETKLSEWKTTTNNTDDTAMKGEIQTEINNLEKLDITSERVDELSRRLTNIRSQLKAVVAAIDSLKLGTRGIKDISDTGNFLSYGGISANRSDITNGGLDSYAESLFQEKFTPKTLPTMEHFSEDNYNVTINPVTGEVKTPEFFKVMHQKYSETDPSSVEETENQKDEAKDEAEKMKKSATEKGYKGGGGNIPSPYTNPGHLGSLKGLIDTLGRIVSGDIRSMRDGLYATVYAMEMFSYDTYENEGRYHLLEHTNPDKIKGLKPSTVSEAYNAVNGAANARKTWLSESPLDSYNKSLTNHRICQSNNEAYAGEIEYILYGDTNKENIRKSYEEIFGIRYGLNLVSGFQHFWSIGPDPTANPTAVCIKSVALAIASLTGGLIPEAVTKAVLIPILTVFETCSDMNRLESGLPVEMYKMEIKQWWYSLSPSGSTISDFTKTLKGGLGRENTGEGIFYSDYMMLFLLVGYNSGGQDKVYKRTAEVIEANMKKLGVKDYSMKNAQVYFNLTAKLKVKPLMTDIPLFVNEGYADELNASTTWCTYDIDVVRGY